jgi:hypothetical protein
MSSKPLALLTSYDFQLRHQSAMLRRIINQDVADADCDDNNQRIESFRLQSSCQVTILLKIA